MKFKFLIIAALCFFMSIINGFNIKSEESGGNLTEKVKKALLAERGRIINTTNDGDIILSENEIYRKYKNERSSFEKIKYKDCNYLFFLLDFTDYGTERQRLEGWYNYSGSDEWTKFIEYRIYDKRKIRGVFDKGKGRYIVVCNSDGFSKEKELFSLLLDAP